MDYLTSLNMPNGLPEHQTNLNNEKIIKKLESKENKNVHLGINVCCNCAAPVISVQCEKCRRIKYCSKRCKKEDCTMSSRIDEEEGPTSEGHTPIVCSLLRLCKIDEQVEDILLRQKESTSKIQKSTSNISTKEFEESEARIKSEYESYAATISHFLMQEWLASHLQESNSKKNKQSIGITIHIIGASDDGELSTTFLNAKSILDIYTDALADIMEMKNWNIINLQFIGPECTTPVNKTHKWNTIDVNYKITISTIKTDYNSTIKSEPDVIIFFNPGFTCQDDYSTWEKSLRTLKAKNIPFLVTTNTQMEAMSDLQYLYDKSFINSLPSFLSDDSDNVDDDDNETSISFFEENPSCGMRVRQSNTMANDLYVKSRWMFGGVFNDAKSGSIDRHSSLICQNENASSNYKKNKLDESNDLDDISSNKKQKKKYFI